MSRNLRLESLERRELMDADLGVAITRLALLHDTGDNATDRVTANWTVAGSLSGDRSGRELRVQFDHDRDGLVDGQLAVTAEASSFAYDPRDHEPRLALHTGTVDLAYRPALFDPNTGQVVAGRWQTFSFTAESPPAAVWELVELRLANDTGASATDRVTWEPAFVGTVRRLAENRRSAAGGQSGADDSDLSSIILPTTSELAHAAVEWDLDGDDAPDARTWLEGNANVQFVPQGLSYGAHRVQGRVSVFDSQYGTALRSDWATLEWVLVAEPPADIAQLRLTLDDGISSDDRISGNSTVIGQLRGPNEALATATIYYDVDGDGRADGRIWADASGEFTLRPRNLAPGDRSLWFRASRWDATANAEVFGDWVEFTFTYLPPVPPAPVRLALTPSASGANGGSWQLVGETPATSAGTFVEMDVDGDGVAEFTASVDQQGRFAAAIVPGSPGPAILRARTVVWDSWDRVERASEWHEFPCEIPDLPVVGGDLAEVRLRHDTGAAPDDRRTADPTVEGRVQLADPRSLAWVEIDRNADQTSDVVVPVDREGAFLYVPAGLALGQVQFALRAAVWDSTAQRVVRQDWQSFGFEYVREPVAAPQLEHVGLLADTGAARDDRHTATTWLEGRWNTVGAEPTLIEVDHNGDDQVDGIALADSDGTFTYDPGALPWGPIEVRMRALSWHPAENRFQPSDWSSFEFVHENQPDAPPEIAAVSLAPAAESSPGRWLVTGRAIDDRQLAGITLQFDVDGDERVDGIARTNSRGQFACELSGIREGTSRIRARTAYAIDGSGEQYGPWQDIEVPARTWADPSQLPDATPRDELGPLTLVADTGNSSQDRSTSDSRLAGQVLAASPVDGRLVEFDHDQDGVVDGTARADSEGRFEYAPVELREGLVTMSARLAAAGAEAPGEWTSLRFVLAADPDGPAAQQLATAFAGYEASRDEAQQQYRQAVEAAQQQRRLDLQQAVAERNAAFHNNLDAQQAAVNAANETFQAEAGRAEADFAAAIQQAIDQFAARLAAFGSSRETQQLPPFVWPAAPAVNRLDRLDQLDPWRYQPPSLNQPGPASAADPYDPRSDGSVQLAVVAADQAEQQAHASAQRLQRQRLQDAEDRHATEQLAAETEASRRRQAVQATYARDLSATHPSIDLAQAAADYRRAALLAEKEYAAARQTHAADLRSVVEEQQAIRDEAIDAALAAYQRKLEDLARYFGQHPPRTPEDYQRLQEIERQWRIDAYHERETAIAAANRAFADQRALAHRQQETRDADALIAMQRTMRDAEQVWAELQLEWDRWDGLRRIDAWERLVTALAATEYDLLVARTAADHAAAQERAGANAATREQLAAAALATATRHSAALRRVLENSHGGLPDLPEISHARQRAAAEADRVLQAATAAAAAEQRRAMTENTDGAARADAEQQQGLALAAAYLQRGLDTLRAEARRWRDLVAAAYAESRGEIAARFNYHSNFLNLWEAHERTVIAARYQRATDEAIVEQAYHHETRDIQVDYMRARHEQPIEVPLQEAAVRREESRARADHGTVHARINAAETWSDSALADYLQYELAVHQLAEQRAAQVANITDTYVRSMEQAATQQQLAGTAARLQRQVADVAASAALVRERTDIAADLELAIAQAAAGWVRASTAAQADRDVKAAELRRRQVAAWSQASGTPSLWGTFHLTLATSDVSERRTSGAAEQQWARAWTDAEIARLVSRGDRERRIADEQSRAYEAWTNTAAATELQMVQDQSQAIMQAAGAGSAATARRDHSAASTDRQAADASAGQRRNYAEGLRDAHWNELRAVADANLERRLGALSAEELAARLDGSAHQRRVEEGAAFVAWVSGRAAASTVWTRDTAAQRTTWVRDLGQIAAHRVAALEATVLVAGNQELGAWQQMLTATDAIAGWSDRAAATAQAAWNLALAKGGSAWHLATTRTQDTAARESELATHDFRRALLRQYAVGTNTLYAAAGGSEGNPGTTAEIAALLGFQANVARQDADFADRIRAARAWLASERASANTALTNELNRADLNWVAALSLADEELVGRLTSAIENYGQQSRAATGTFFADRLQADNHIARDQAQAQSVYAGALALAQEVFLVSLATARQKLDIAAATAAADLHVAGHSVGGLHGKPDDALDPDQRAYRAAIDAASAAYRQAEQHAVQMRAAAFGDGWVAVQLAEGTAGQAYAQGIAQADEKLAMGLNGAETAYGILVADATRRHTAAIAGAETTRDTAQATALRNWTAAVGVDDVAYQQRVGQAEATRTQGMVQAEVAYHLAPRTTATPTTLPTSLRNDWIATVAPAYTQYRGAVAQSDASLANLLARAAATRNNDLAKAEVNLSTRRGAARIAFARNSIEAFNDYQTTVVAASNTLMEKSAVLDGRRGVQIAGFVADYGLALAQAGKQLLIDQAAAPAAISQAAQDRYAAAVALANRQLAIGVADADYLRDSALIPLQESHSQLTIGAANELDRDLSVAELALRGAGADAGRLWAVERGGAEARHARARTSAENAWRVSRSRAESAWIGAGLQGEMTVLVGASQQAQTPWMRYQADRATAVAQWWTGWAGNYTNWIQARNSLETAYTQSVTSAFQTAVATLSSSDATRIREVATAGHDARFARANSRQLLGHDLGTPASVADLQIAGADRDYRTAIAEAVYGLETGGTTANYQAAVAAAEATRHATVSAARSNYLESETEAVGNHRSRELAADIAARRRSTNAESVWAEAAQLALGKWDLAVDTAMATRVRGLARVDADYRLREALSSDAAFAQLSAANGTPWAHLDAEMRHADLARTRVLQPAVQQRTSELAAATVAAAKAEAQAASRLVAADQASRRALQEEIGQQRWLAAEQQEQADRELAAQGHTAPAESWISPLTPLAWAPSLTSVDWGQLLGQFAAAFPTDSPAPANLHNRSLPAPFVPGHAQTPPGNDPGEGAAPRAEASARWPARAPVLPGQFARPGEAAERAAMEAMAARNAPVPDSASASQQRSGWRWFLDDLGLMAQYPLASAVGALEGTKTSAKVFVNGTVSTLKSNLTFGFASEPWELIHVTETDLANGYEAAFGLMRISQEIGLAGLLGGLAKMDKSPTLAGWAKAASYWDLGQNVVSASRGTYGVAFGDGWTWGNTIELVGGLAGLSGNAISGLSRLSDSVPTHVDEVLDFEVGIGVDVNGMGDKIGHAFAVFREPGGEFKAVGFYPLLPFDLKNRADLRSLFLGENGGLPGLLRFEREHLASPLARIKLFRVSFEDFARAVNFVDEFNAEVMLGQQRYRLTNQCATFAKSAMRRAGLRPFVPVPYPPVMNFLMWLQGVPRQG